MRQPLVIASDIVGGDWLEAMPLVEPLRGLLGAPGGLPQASRHQFLRRHHQVQLFALVGIRSRHLLVEGDAEPWFA